MEAETEEKKGCNSLPSERGNWNLNYLTVLPHNGGFCNNCTPKRCLYTSVHSKQMHYKTTCSHKGYMKSLEFYEKYITMFFLEKKLIFNNIILTQNHD
jgi:hypothetical protein